MTESTPSRRRGDDLEHAIFEATLEELAEVGYANLRMESIAARARAGKASLYKRWPSRAHLVRAAVRHRGATSEMLFEPTGAVRADLERVMHRIAEVQAGPDGEAVRGYVGELTASSDGEELRDDIERPRVRIVTAIFEAGIKAGAVRPEALTPRIANLAPSLMTHYFLTRGEPAPPEVIDEILDLVVMPLITETGR
ncbi:TetR/AcrR family transcriptional regulator [Glycomyces arizonensis]|uniref:TetR/AcrR family transcriptional regulator n=1 Tax=Glycomyces arizonensis TaxID=256035 RepID=UPI000426A405|nr:TetR/AcrR family transcriptional regulator [Glycomyces arizonensis]